MTNNSVNANQQYSALLGGSYGIINILPAAYSQQAMPYLRMQRPGEDDLVFQTAEAYAEYQKQKDALHNAKTAGVRARKILLLCL